MQPASAAHHDVSGDAVFVAGAGAPKDMTSVSLCGRGADAAKSFGGSSVVTASAPKGRALGRSRTQTLSEGRRAKSFKGRLRYFIAVGAIRENSKFRQAWNSIITFFLIYMGTYFVYRLCFVDFRLETPMDMLVDAPPNCTERCDRIRELEMKPLIGSTAIVFEWVLTVTFWVDLVINFFFSYRDDVNQEVLDIRQTAWHYFRSSFAINFVACIPPELVEIISANMPSTTNQGLRLARLQRVSRITRLMRVTRLAKLTSYSKKLTKWFEKHRGARVLTLFVVFVWLVHLLACGWYLCAALHEEPRDTWVYRRSVDHEGTSLIQVRSFTAWCHAMYFVVTVFTTVGFGDMSAGTAGEMLYVCCLMMIGVVYHSIIISEVINVVTSNDRASEFMLKQRDLIDSFSVSTEMHEETRKEICDWICLNAKTMVGDDYCKSDVQKLITGRHMPRDLLAKVPNSLYEGHLVKNRLLSMCTSLGRLPPRLVIQLALMLVKVEFSTGDIVYEEGEHAFSLYLVHSGVFSYSTKHVSGKVMSPFVLFPFGSFFGDIECFDGSQRRCSACCESRSGSLLVLTIEDLKELASVFPEYAEVWRRAAHHRDRLQRIGRLVNVNVTSELPLHYKDLAVRTLQRYFRQKLKLQQQGRAASCRDNLIGEVVYSTVERRLCRRDSRESIMDLDRKLNRKVDALASQLSAVTQKLDQLLEGPRPSFGGSEPHGSPCGLRAAAAYPERRLSPAPPPIRGVRPCEDFAAPHGHAELPGMMRDDAGDLTQ